MKFKVLIVFLLMASVSGIQADNITQLIDSLHLSKHEVIDTDSVLEKIANPVPKLKKSTRRKHETRLQEQKIPQLNTPAIDIDEFKIPAYIEPVKIDSLVLQNNPFFIELVFMGYPNDFKFDKKPDLQTLFYGSKPFDLNNVQVIQPKVSTPEQIISELRRNAREMITRTAADVYVMTYDDLPDPDGTKNHFIREKSLGYVKFVDDNKVLKATSRMLIVKSEQLGPWLTKASGQAQFSENYISQNWYQGGNSNVAILGILCGQLNYDDKKNIQWENTAEWRLGFNTVTGDTTRILSTNDDVLRINSKLGIKAGGNFFYSGSVDFSTQFFNSYKAVNSPVMKATFLTPVRLNVGMGLDYKYKKLFSLMLSPISLKYIYINERDAKIINPNLFGIKTGENHLSEIGTLFKAQCSFSPFQELQVDSRFNFYTNYQKVEIDWEIVGNFTINRYLSTRILLNPRYDNTVIQSAGDKARLQFKELLSFGFSYKLLN